MNNIHLTILEKINELDRQNLTIVEVDAILTPYLIGALPKDIQDAYNTMIMDKIPF